MANAFYGFSDWRGLDGRVSRKVWRLRTTVASAPDVQFQEALDANDTIVAALDPITEATLNNKGVNYVSEVFTAGLGDLSEQALLNVWAQDPMNTLDALAVSQVFVPAPVPTIFQGASGEDYNKIDRADGLLAAFVSALADYAYVSDMETIDFGAGVNGMKNGRRVTRKIPRPVG